MILRSTRPGAAGFMPAASMRRSYGRFLAAASALALAISAGVGTAHAASVGTLTSQSLLGSSIAQHAITDKFDETNNLSLNGTTTADGATWVVSPGLFRITSSGTPLAGVVKTPTVPASATVPGFVNVSVGGDIHPPTTGKSFGILTHAAGSESSAATFLVYNRATKVLTLERISPTSTVTVWGTSTGLTLSNNYLLLKYLNGVYTASVDGVTKITYTPTTAERTELEAYSRVGIGSIDDTVTSFDNFMEYGL